MAAIKIAVLLLSLAVSGWAKECSKLSETGIFEDNTCKKLCTDSHDTEEYRFRNSEKGGAFSFDCFCGADLDIEACADKDFDVNAQPSGAHFGGFSPLALGVALLIAFLRA